MVAERHFLLLTPFSSWDKVLLSILVMGMDRCKVNIQLA